MQPCRMQKQPDAAGARSMHSTPNAKPMSSSVLAHSVVEGPTEVKCAECYVVRERDQLISKLLGLQEAVERRLAGLTPRQHEIMEMVLAGHPSKNIAADLQISQRTVENHRASIMKKTGARSLPELTRLALAAHWSRPIGAAVPEGAPAPARSADEVEDTQPHLKADRRGRYATLSLERLALPRSSWEAGTGRPKR